MELLTKIIHQNEDEEDNLCWGLTPDGAFSVNLAHHLATHLDPQCQNTLWNKLWKIKVLEKIKTFIWALLHGRLMTNIERFRRCLTSDINCKACDGAPEFHDHLLRHCRKVTLIWKVFTLRSSRRRSQTLTFREWISWNLMRKEHDNELGDWNRLFAIILWWTWKWRNELVFCNSFPSMNDKIQRIQNFLYEVRSAMHNSYLTKGGLGTYYTT